MIYLWLSFASQSQVGSCFERASAYPVAQDQSARSRLRWPRVRPDDVGAVMRLVDLALIFVLALATHRLALGAVALSPLFWFAVA